MGKQGFVILGALIAAVGCGDEAASSKGNAAVGPCMPAATFTCTCEDGSARIQSCDPVSATWGACDCTSAAIGGGAGISSGGSSGLSGGSAGSGFGAAGGGAGVDAVGGAAGVGVTAGVGAAGDGAAGVGAAGTGAAGDGAAGTGVMTTGDGPKIPTTTETCPTLATGNVTILGKTVQLWVGTKQADKKGAVFFYWHGTGQHSNEAQGLLGSALQEIPAEGGIVASFESTTGKGSTTGNNVWYTGDYEMADIILACAVKQLNIDTRRIYTGGCSAGGLQAGAMVYGRSSYLAGAMPNSGGTTGIPGTTTFDDPSHIPALITAHGTAAKDKVGIEFATSSLNECKAIAGKGGFAVDCEHAAGHCGAPSALTNAQWAFLKAHPFGVSPEPYAAGLPMPPFPDYCKIVK